MELPRLSGQRREFLAQATERYAGAFEGSPAAEYLESREIGMQVAERFQLGYVLDPVEGHERFRGRLSIPYVTPTGVSMIRFRGITKDFDPKYDQEAGQRTPLFNVRDLHDSAPWIAICEGELDAIVMSGVVGVPAVGIPGVDHWNKNASIWGRLFQDYESVFVVMDPDKAGRDLLPEVVKKVENPVVIELPADVNDTVLTHGAGFVLEQMGLD